MSRTRPRPRWLRPAWGALGVLLVAEAVGELAGPTGLDAKFVFHDWLHDLGGALAAGLCAARVVTDRRARAAWTAIASALVSFAAGQVVWSLLYRHQPPRPTPDAADVFFLAFYPFAIAGLVLLIREHVPRFDLHRWMDGISIVLIVAAPGVALVLVPVAEKSTGDVLADAMNFAYPLLDLLLVGAVLGIFAITDWRPGRAWGWLGVGFLLMAIPDSISTVVRLGGDGAHSHGPYHLEAYDFLWTLGMAAIALAAWTRPPDLIAAPTPTGLRAIALPLAAQALGVAIQVVDYIHPIPAGGRPITLALLVIGTVQIYISRPRARA